MAAPASQSELQPPVRTLEIELSGLVDAIDDRHPDGGRYGWATALVRLHGAPLGSIAIALPDGGVTGEAARRLAESQLSREIEDHRAADGDELEDTPVCQRSLARFMDGAPALSVVVASRDRPEQVSACVAAILATSYPRLEVIVVDNAPPSDATARAIAERYAGRPEVHYLREDRPGTSRARNRGLQAVTSDYVAFADDDILVDQGWAAALVRPMAEDPRIGGVTGLIVAAELETDAQLWIEEYGGFAKGYRQVIHELANTQGESPLFPYAAGALGTGATMAFRTSVLRSLGGFDTALGGGTPARGGEDLAVFVGVLLAGWKLVYEPAAIARHFHHRSYERLCEVMLGYGSGLSAYLTRTVVRDPGRIPGIARRLLLGTRFLLDPRSSKNARKSPSYPAELTRLELRGIACGPLWYLRGVLASRRRLRHRMPRRSRGGGL